MPKALKSCQKSNKSPNLVTQKGRLILPCAFFLEITLLLNFVENVFQFTLFTRTDGRTRTCKLKVCRIGSICFSEMKTNKIRDIERGKRKFVQEKAGVIGQNISNEVDRRRKTSVQIKKKRETKKQEWRAVVVAKLVEQSLPVPEVRGSNPVIGNNLFV